MSDGDTDPVGGGQTEASDDRFSELDTWSSERIMEEIVTGNERAVRAVAEALPDLAAVARVLEARIAAGGRLIYVGAGTSGRIAVQDAVELPPTFGFDRAVALLAGGSGAGERAQEGAEDDEETARDDIARTEVGPADLVVGVAASGNTPYTVAAIRAARERGATTVGLANNRGSRLLAEADLAVLLDTGPEVLAGSTRLAAGTAQKIALNSLTTSVLVRLGGAYGNLMVGMSLSNEKLRRRGVAVICEATGAGEQEAAEALRQADGSLRTAIVMLLAQISAVEAGEAVELAGGRVREALKSLGCIPGRLG